MEATSPFLHEFTVVRQTFPGKHSIHSREPSTDSSVDSTKVPLGVSMNFIGVSAGIWVRDYLQNRNVSITVASPKQMTAIKPGAHCIACRQPGSLESVLSGVLSSRKVF